jgi:peptidoglycan/xylan/chitin deacetylase (PgdA/CDA1 family)
MVRVCLTFDFDAIAIWLHTFDSPTQRSRHSRGLFGANVATPRLLELLDFHDVPSTWFVPGHTIETFPEVCAAVADDGHDVQHHGWKHVDPVKYDSYEEERADVERGVEAIEALTGSRPVGYRSPAGEFSEHTLEILQELDFEYDASLMGTDYEPYYVHENWNAPLDEPFDRGTPTDIVEIPRSWQRNDFTAMTYIPYPQLWGYADEDVMFKKWRDKFDWVHANTDDAVFVLVFHPQCIGRVNRVSRLSEFISYMKGKPDVEFETTTDVARRFHAN